MTKEELKVKYPYWARIIYSEPDDDCQCTRKGHPGEIRTKSGIEQPCLCVCMDSVPDRAEFVRQVGNAAMAVRGNFVEPV